MLCLLSTLATTRSLLPMPALWVFLLLLLLIPTTHLMASNRLFLVTMTRLVRSPCTCAAWLMLCSKVASKLSVVWLKDSPKTPTAKNSSKLQTNKKANKQRGLTRTSHCPGQLRHIAASTVFIAPPPRLQTGVCLTESGENCGPNYRFYG